MNRAAVVGGTVDALGLELYVEWTMTSNGKAYKLDELHAVYAADDINIMPVLTDDQIHMVEEALEPVIDDWGYDG